MERFSSLTRMKTLYLNCWAVNTIKFEWKITVNRKKTWILMTFWTLSEYVWVSYNYLNSVSTYSWICTNYLSFPLHFKHKVPWKRPIFFIDNFISVLSSFSNILDCIKQSFGLPRFHRLFISVLKFLTKIF